MKNDTTWGFMARAPKMVIPPQVLPKYPPMGCRAELEEAIQKQLAEEARRAADLAKPRLINLDPFFTGVENWFRALLRLLIPLSVFILFVGVFHLNPIISLLIALGIGPFDILRAAGIVGPKKLDKNGKEIDDPF